MIETFQAASDVYEWLEQCGNGWQFGEQGIIDAIVERLGIKEGTCVEIGAGDGQKLPLTCERLYNAGWRTICYEIDAYSQSLLKFKFPLAIVRGAWEKGSLSKTAKTDLLVVDTDAGDLHIVQEVLGELLRDEMPDIVIVEHFDKAFDSVENKMHDIPRHICGLQLRSGATIQENSDGIADALGIFGYRRIGWTRVNTFFVKDELCTKLT